MGSLRVRRGVALSVAVAGLGAWGAAARADAGAWAFLRELPPGAAAAPRWFQPPVYQPVRLDLDRLVLALREAPMEFTPGAREHPVVLTLPRPDGTFARFGVFESPIMEPGLAARFPDIRTWAGQGIDDPNATVRLDVTMHGFHAQILSPEGAAYIDPIVRGDTALYAVYWKRDYRSDLGDWRCLTEGRLAAPPTGNERTGEQLRTYRLACAATGEYTAFHGGTVPAGQAAIVTAVNRVTQVYELEICARLTLVANNSLLVYTNAGTDPYSNNNGQAMLSQNQATCDSVIGSANYDIGHVFSTGGGGIAGLGVVCRAGLKAQGVTGLPQPIGDPFYIDFVAHEMGHQFGGNHNFNGSSCGGARWAPTAYEPGSGSTIMGYAGVCGPGDNLQPHSDPYMGFISFQEMRAYMSGFGGTCGQLSNTGNNGPTVNAGADYTIPRQTPFQLTATGSDPNSDPITYCWEERDLGPAQPASGAGSGDNGTSPIFRSFTGTAGPTRIFPRLSNLLNNSTTIGEIMPTTSRFLNFRVSVRDNRAGAGGVGFDDMRVTVTNTAGPFQVTSPNTAVLWQGNQTVTWNVANTNNAPVSCANVNILLSTDGGNTWPTVLKSNTPNDGSEGVTMPNILNGLARIRVECAGNIFFDISNSNFSILPGLACYPDCDGNGTLNVNDYICFQTKFALGDPYADCDNNGVRNVNDYICFQTKFALGC